MRCCRLALVVVLIVWVLPCGGGAAPSAVAEDRCALVQEGRHALGKVAAAAEFFEEFVVAEFKACEPASERGSAGDKGGGVEAGRG